MSNKQELFRYKGYFGSAEVSHEDHCLVGQILYINDLIMYQGATYKELEQAFQHSVDDYLDFCIQIGKEPEKTYSGSFNVRIGSDLHSKAARAAVRAGVSLNDYVRQAITQSVAETRALDLVSDAPLGAGRWHLASPATTVSLHRLNTLAIGTIPTTPDALHDLSSSAGSQNERIEIFRKAA